MPLSYASQTLIQQFAANNGKLNADERPYKNGAFTISFKPIAHLLANGFVYREEGEGRTFALTEMGWNVARQGIVNPPGYDKKGRPVGSKNELYTIPWVK